MNIEQLLDKRNSTNIMLCMLNTPITGIRYNRAISRGECECDCAEHDCDDSYCDGDCGRDYDDCDCISII